MYKNKNEEFGNDLQERLFKFAVNIILACRELPEGKDYNIISYQLIKSATSAGANYSPRQI